MKNLLILLTLSFSINLFAQPSQKPNVLFIIADDLTATAVSAYENKACKTPNIDKLASEGVQYSKAYCQYPVCGPSRASFMSGYYPNATTTFGYVSGRENIGPERKTWSQLFKENGYYTARVSKIYHMGVPIDIETGSNGQDDEASWDERYNSQGPEWTAQRVEACYRSREQHRRSALQSDLCQLWRICVAARWYHEHRRAGGDWHCSRHWICGRRAEDRPCGHGWQR